MSSVQCAEAFQTSVQCEEALRPVCGSFPTSVLVITYVLQWKAENLSKHSWTIGPCMDFHGLVVSRDTTRP